jgi:hypothetical protein
LRDLNGDLLIVSLHSKVEERAKKHTHQRGLDSPFFFFVVLRIKSRALCMLGKCSTIYLITS